MPLPLFDHGLRARRRDRAVRHGVETFLFDRAFEECLERLAEIRRPFRSVLLAGCPNARWARQIAGLGSQVTIIDPGPQMASAARATVADLEFLPFDAESFDLCLSIGLLDSVNDMQLALASVARILEPDGLFMGAVAGGQSLPRLRAAMLAADQTIGQASPHVHPRIEAPALANLLSSSGFSMPVVDVDRVDLSYGGLDDLVRDLRAMGSTNILSARPRRPLLRASLQAARGSFLGGSEKAIEQLEILHFAAWKSASPSRQARH